MSVAQNVDELKTIIGKMADDNNSAAKSISLSMQDIHSGVKSLSINAPPPEMFSSMRSTLDDIEKQQISKQ